MDGVAPAPNGGYYLVKGRGCPRIDVIGSCAPSRLAASGAAADRDYEVRGDQWSN